MKRRKVAIPVFGSQVSLRCDCAPEVLFLEIENGEVVSRKRTALEGMNPLERIGAISASGVTLLACGALPGFYRRMIEGSGIQIIQVEGMPVAELLERLKEGKLPGVGT